MGKRLKTSGIFKGRKKEIKSGKIKKRKRGRKVIAVSGGFDPIHVGHIQMFVKAKTVVGHKGRLVVIINCDEWLIRKKGYNFMDIEDRASIIRSIGCVDDVYTLHSDSNDVCQALEDIRPDFFANGGDRRNIDNVPESEICETYGIKLLFNIGGDKIRSSTAFLERYKKLTINK